MGKRSNLLRNFFGGLVALGGASLVSWQAVLIYYLIIGRVEVGEEHPPFIVIAVLLVIGAILMAAGYKLTNPSVKEPIDER